MNFWDIRSADYDKLFWVKDKSYIDAIIEVSKLSKDQLLLDVGTGTGVVANAVKDYVHHVVAVDTSDSMLGKGKWCDVSVLKWDIGDKLFASGLFDRVFARMVFHHIFDGLDRAIIRCFDLLKPGGMIVVAEGVPPSEDSRVVKWYTDMFRLKEKRRTFSQGDIRRHLERNGFRDIVVTPYIMNRFNINNWLMNSGLLPEIQKEIYDVHVNAPENIKEAYNMRIEGDECFIRTTNIIMTGLKCNTY